MVWSITECWRNKLGLKSRKAQPSAGLQWSRPMQQHTLCYRISSSFAVTPSHAYLTSPSVAWQCLVLPVFKRASVNS